MAKAIQLDLPVRDREAELHQRLTDGTVEHAEAILEFLELLEVLRKHKVLSTLRGAAGAGPNLITYVSAAAAQPESIRAMRNLITLSKVLSSIDPDMLDTVVQSVAKSLGDLPKRPPGLLKIVKTLWSPPARRALFAAGLLLTGIGYALEKRRRSHS